MTCRRVDGAYEAGQGRNISEAKAVVEEAAALMRKRIDRSIGIVAVNKAQSELIEGMMDELAASDPEVQAYRETWEGTLETFLVKNLENVQGDERDFILISTVVTGGVDPRIDGEACVGEEKGAVEAPGLV